ETQTPPRSRWRGGGPPEGAVCRDTLTLTAEQAEPGPNGRWPDAFSRAPDGTQVSLTAGQSAGQALTYRFPTETPIPATEWPRITLEWAGLRVTDQQNARASLARRRNEKLLGDDGPATTEGFVYRTQRVEAPEVVTPLNVWPGPIDIPRL